MTRIIRATVGACTIVLIGLVLAGCGAHETDAPTNGPDTASSAPEEVDPGVSATSTDSADELQPLTVGLMPAVDTAPFFVAQDAGYFTDAGLTVRFELFTNAQDRQSALQTGQIDGAMTDLVAVAVNVAGGFDIRATMLTEGVFPVLAQPGATEQDVVRIGLMEVSVVNYLADQWLAPRYNLEKVFINSIPARLEAVISGQLDMGVFPEPIASMGELRGLEKLVFDPIDGISPDVIVFTGVALREKRREIAAFHAAYNRAVVDIAQDPAIATAAILDNIPNVSAELGPLISLPTYFPARLPAAPAVDRIIAWTESVVASDLGVTADDVLDRSFIDR